MNDALATLFGHKAAFPVIDRNVRAFRGASFTLQVRVKDCPHLMLMVPPDATEYWQLELAEHSGKPAIDLGTVDELPVDVAKKLAKSLLGYVRRTAEDGPTLKKFMRVYWAAHGCQLAASTRKAAKKRCRILIARFGDEPLTWISRLEIERWNAEFSACSPGCGQRSQGIAPEHHQPRKTLGHHRPRASKSLCRHSTQPPRPR